MAAAASNSRGLWMVSVDEQASKQTKAMRHDAMRCDANGRQADKSDVGRCRPGQAAGSEEG